MVAAKACRRKLTSSAGLRLRSVPCRIDQCMPRAARISLVGFLDALRLFFRHLRHDSGNPLATSLSG